MADLALFDPRWLKYFGEMPTTEEEAGGLQYPGIGEITPDILGGLLSRLGSLGQASLNNLLNPSRSIQQGYDAIFPPSYSVNTAGQKVDPKTGQVLLPGGRTTKGQPPIQGPTAPPTPGGYMDQPTPPTQSTTPPPKVQGGFSRALPPEVNIEIPKEYGDFAGQRMQYYNSLGVDSANILKIVSEEVKAKMAADKVGPTIQTPPITDIEKVGEVPGTGLTPQEMTGIGITQPTTPQSTEMQSWEPRKPTDWASEYEKTASDLPKWSDMPQMTGLPEYKEPDYGGTLGSILRNLVYGAGMGAIGKDPVRADMERAALEKSDIEKRRTEQITDINKKRDFFMTRATAITNAKLKSLEMKKTAEDKAVTDELGFYQTAIEADPTAMNKLAPRIAQLRGIDPKDIQSLYDKATGKWKIARTPEEIEMEKMQAGINFRTKLIEKYAPELGLTDPRDIAKYKLTGQIEEGTVEKLLSRKLLDAYKSGDPKKIAEVMKEINNYKVSSDAELVREGYRYQEAMEDLPKLKGKVSDAVYESLFANVQSMKWTGKMLPSVPRNLTGTTMGKMDPIYKLALESIDDPDKWNAFVTAHGVAPDTYVQMIDDKTTKIQMPATAWQFGLSKLQYPKELLASKYEQLEYENQDFIKSPKKGTPLRDYYISEAVPHIRAMYGSIIRKIEESTKQKMSDSDIAKLYEKIQIEGPPRFAAPKAKK